MKHSTAFSVSAFGIGLSITAAAGLAAPLLLLAAIAFGFVE